MNKVLAPQENDSLAPKLMLWGALILSSILVFSWLDSVPGLHADEAFVGLRAHDIMKGERPILGMNGYTGSLHQYFVALFFAAFGFKVWALRAFGAFTSVISVLLYYLCIKRLSNDRIAALSALILSTMPFFVGFSRIANEVFMLNPILCLGATWLFLTAHDRSPRTAKLFYFYAGISIGLGIWSHVIFMTFVFALGVTALLRKRRELFTSSALYLTIVGALISLSPRIYFEIGQVHSRGSDMSPFRGIVSRLHEWPSVFLHVLHGDEIFQRFTGAILFNPPALTTYVWSAGGWLLLIFAFKKGLRSFETAIVTFTSALAIATLAISPGNAERYLLLPLYTTPLFISYFLWRLLNGKWLYATVTLLTGYQLTLVGTNYFHSFLESGGQNSLFGLGEESETSNHYIGTKDLYANLAKMGAAEVCSEFFIAEPLSFYQLATPEKLRITFDENRCLRKAASKRTGVYAVVYKLGKRILNLDRLPGFIPTSSDSHFLILEPKEPSNLY